MKTIVIKKNDGGIILIYPNSRKFGEEIGKRPFSELKHLVELQKNEHNNIVGWSIVDNDKIPQKNGLDSRKQLYWDDSSGNLEIKVDHNWEKRIMPDHQIKEKYLNRLSMKLDEELDKQKPDEVKCMKLQREHDKLKSMKFDESTGYGNENSVFWLNKAIEGLDEKVSKGESDKPEIRQKILDKISKLEDK